MSRKRPLNVLFFGPYNGDDALARAALANALADWRAVLGEAAGSFTLLANTTETPADFPKEENLRFLRYDPLFSFNPRLWLVGADILVLFGRFDSGNDSLPAKPLLSYVSLVAAAKLLGVKVVAMGLDLDAHTLLCKELSKRVVNGCDLLLVESPEALARLEHWQVGALRHLTADGGYRQPREGTQATEIQRLAKRLDLHPERGPVILFALNELFENDKARDKAQSDDARENAGPDPLLAPKAHFLSEIARYGDGLVETRGAELVFLAFDPASKALSKAAIETLHHRHRARLVSAHEESFGELRTLFALAAWVVSSRPQTLPFATSVLTPTLGLCTDSRLACELREMGLADLAIDFMTPEQNHPNTYRLAELLDETSALVNDPTQKVMERLKQARATLATRAAHTRVLLGDWLVSQGLIAPPDPLALAL